MRRGIVVGGIVLIALIAAIVTGLGGGSGNKTASKHPQHHAKAPAHGKSFSTALSTYKAPAVSPACNKAPTPPAASTTTVPAKGHAVSIVPAPKKVPFPKLNGSSPRYTKFSTPPPFCINVSKSYTAVMNTTAGPITIKLLPKYAPQTVNNFVFLAGYHYFDGVYFHRVIRSFMDQGGDPLGTGLGGPGYTIPDEYPKSPAAYDNGAIAMANTGKPHTGGSQFFLVVGHGGSQLSPSYTMFGQTTAGFKALDTINAAGAPASNSAGTPTKYYRILSVKITET